MSNAGIGAFAQGLVSGYKAGDDLLTAQSRRKYIDQQTALDEQKTLATKKALEDQKKLDGLKEDLAASIGDMFRTTTMPQQPAEPGAAGGAIAAPSAAGQAGGQPAQAIAAPGMPKVNPDAFARYSEKLMTYLTQVDPLKADEFRRTRRSEALADQGRELAETTAGLLAGDPAYIGKAAKIFRNVENGIDIEPTQSKFMPNGNLQLSLYDTKTGESKGTRELTRDQILIYGMRGAASITDFATMYGNMETRRENARHYAEQERLTARGQDITAQTNREMAASRAQSERFRQEDKKENAISNDIRSVTSAIRDTLAPDIDRIKRTPEYQAEPGKWDAQISALETTRAIAERAALENITRGYRISPSEMIVAARQAQAGKLQLEPVKDRTGAISKEFGMLPGTNAIFPYLPNMKPKQ